jgi:hypothetical protein
MRNLIYYHQYEIAGLVKQKRRIEMQRRSPYSFGKALQRVGVRCEPIRSKE